MGNNGTATIVNITNKMAPAPVLSLKSSLSDIINISHLPNSGKNLQQNCYKTHHKIIGAYSIGLITLKIALFDLHQVCARFITSIYLMFVRAFRNSL
jgi:hypothetical protein